MVDKLKPLPQMSWYRRCARTIPAPCASLTAIGL